MGYNRSGTRRTQRMKRAKKEAARLAKKAPPAEVEAGQEGHGIAAGVKSAAAGVVHAVGAAVQSVAHALTGKKETAAPQK